MSPALNYKNIILRHGKCVVNSRTECDIRQKLGKFEFAAPCVCANMKSLINFNLCKLFDFRNWFYVYHRIDGPPDIWKFIVRANQENFKIISISVGIQPEYFDLLKNIKKENFRLDFVTIDLALSYSDSIIPMVKFIQDNFPGVYLIVGNGCTAEWIEFLENLNVNCAKLGLGISQSCRTRQFTGFGSTTVSSLVECVGAAKKIDIMSDGGLTIENNEIWIGDIAKSICLGSTFVMSGSLFSRCIDSPAILNGYYGNASRAAKKHSKNIEGTNISVETNGLTVNEMINLVEDSLKSATSYGGFTKVTDLRNCEYITVL